jgi:predicted dehydrogenase
VQCRGQNVVQPRLADVVFATLEFPGGKLAHVHVSWLDPHKTRKLTVVGSRKMAVFDDTLPAYKVTLYDKGYLINQQFESYAEWITMRQGDIVIPKISSAEPLLLEAQHFVECVRQRRRPISDGPAGALVVSVLEHGQMSLERGGKVVPIPATVTQLRRCA